MLHDRGNWLCLFSQLVPLCFFLSFSSGMESLDKRVWNDDDGDNTDDRNKNKMLKIEPADAEQENDVSLGALPRDVHSKIFEHLCHEHEMLNLSLVCRAFREVSLIDLSWRWQVFYQEMFEYELPLLRFGPLDFRFADLADGRTIHNGENIWAKALCQFRHAIHVVGEECFDNIYTRRDDQLIFTQFNEAMLSIQELTTAQVDPRTGFSEQIVIVHSGSHLLFTPKPISPAADRVIFLGTASLPKPSQHVKIVATNLKCPIMFHFADQSVCFAHLSFAAAYTNQAALNAYLQLEECEEVRISHCMFRSHTNAAIILEGVSSFTTCHLVTKCYFNQLLYGVYLHETAVKLVKNSFDCCFVGVYCSAITRADIYANHFLRCDRAVLGKAYYRLTANEASVVQRRFNPIDSMIALTGYFERDALLVRSFKDQDRRINGGHRVPDVPQRIPFRVEVVYNQFRCTSHRPYVDFEERGDVQSRSWMLASNFYPNQTDVTSDEMMKMVIERFTADKIRVRQLTCRAFNFRRPLCDTLMAGMAYLQRRLSNFDEITRIFVTNDHDRNCEVLAKKLSHCVNLKCESDGYRFECEETDSDDEEDEEGDEEDEEEDGEEDEEEETIKLEELFPQEAFDHGNLSSQSLFCDEDI